MVVAAVEVTGAALLQSPKSSSAVTVACLDVVLVVEPQPAPISFGVRVSGTCIMDEVDGWAGAGAGAGSGVFQALLSKGSKVDASMVGGTAEVVVVVVDVVVVVVMSGLGAGGAGDERLNVELSSSWGEATVGFGGDADDTGGGDERPTRSFAKDEGLCGFAGGDVKLGKPWPKPFDEMDVVRD